MKELTSRLSRVFSLLQKTQPLPDEHDVVWWGPYFIPRAGKWCPTHFTLYDGTLYCRIFIDSAAYGLSWKIGTPHVEFEQGSSSFEFENQKEVLQALEGIDEVEVGPDLYSVHFDELKKKRPDGLSHIRWDPIPQISLITADQKARIGKALKSVS